MKKFTLTFVLCFGTIFSFYAQESAKRIKLLTTDHQTIQQLAKNGVDLRCGTEMHNHDIEMELNSSDIELIENLGVPYLVLIDDLTKHYAAKNSKELPNAIAQLAIEKATSNFSRSSSEETSLDNYLEYFGCSEENWSTPVNFNLGSMAGCLTLQETYNTMDAMRTLYPNLISSRTDASSTSKKTWGNPSSTITNNGLTYNGQGTTRWNPQSIFYVRITGNQAAPEGSKPQILYTSMIHAREVSSLMSNIFFMWYLLENYDTNPAIKNLVDNNELYFIPVVNPDGLRWNQHLSATGGGMQRKNLRPNTGGTTNTSSNRGVDLNRNFDYFWGSAGIGSSGITTSDSYRGPSRASEPETQIIVDFVNARNFKTTLWHHSFANGIPHPYGGNPTFVSGREDEMHKWHEDMTKYNRYVSGATIFTPANGIADDWMVGGAADTNGSIGSGRNILATTPENNHSSEGAFWTNPSLITAVAKRAIRMNLVNAYYGGAYAKLHDLTQSDITLTTSNLNFGIERLGQTLSNFELTITPISSNIISITSPAAQSGISILEQRTVTAQIELDPSIIPYAKIEFKVTLKNDNHVFYETNMVKYYQPDVLLSDNPDVDFLNNWTVAGDWITTTADAYTGVRSIRSTSSVPYVINANRTLTTANTYNLSGADKILLQFFSKWDIERNYDFATIQGSINGSTWVTLCGKYTKPNSVSTTNDAHGQKNNASSRNFQNNNSGGQVYDGDTMNKWVMEEIVIDEDNNSFLLNAPNARFRFLFRTDGTDRPENYSSVYDGIYIDDFKIIKARTLSEPPTAICENITVQLDASGNATISANDIDNGSTDDVAIISYSIDIDTFNCSNVGSPVEVTFTIEDADGQTDSCTALVTVQDSIAPLADIANLIDISEECEVTSLVAPTATDNCGGLVTVSNNAVLPITSSIQIIWTYEDESGNTSTQTQNIIIEDTTAPFCTAQDITVELDEFGLANITSSDIDNGSTDNCGISSLSVFPNSFDANDIGDVNVTLTVTDFFGNETSCNAIVTIIANALNLDTVTEFDFRITPNPFKNNINISVPSNLNGEEFELKLFDLNGRVIFNITKSPINGIINLGGYEVLDDAPYILQISNKNKSLRIFKHLIKF